MSSILRGGIIRHPPHDKGTGFDIPVKCPKCQENIYISEFRGNQPFRCAKCAYPLVCRSDLLLIVAACKKLNSANQAGNAVRILERLADAVPEAGTALGYLANHYNTLPISNMERWNRLISAYAGGDENAREWLDIMCQLKPETYKRGFCGSCGAPKYYVSQQAGNAVCSYCRSTD